MNLTKYFPTVLLLFLLPFGFSGCKTSDPLAGAGDRYSCTGNNPFWKLDISTEEISFVFLSGEKEVFPYKAPVTSDNRKLFVTSREVDDGKSWLKISIEESSCFNSVAGKKFPFKVEVDKDGELFYGCGE